MAMRKRRALRMHLLLERHTDQLPFFKSTRILTPDDCIQFSHGDLLGTFERGCHLILLLQTTSAIVTPASSIDECLPLEIGMELFDGIWPSTVLPVRIVDAFQR